MSVHSIGDRHQDVLIRNLTLEDMKDPADWQEHVRGPVAVQVPDARAARIGEGGGPGERRLQRQVRVDERERRLVLKAGCGLQDGPGREPVGLARQRSVRHGHEQVLPPVAVVVERRGELEVGVLVAEARRAKARDGRRLERPPGVEIRPERVILKAGLDGIGQSVPVHVQEDDAAAVVRAGKPGIEDLPGPVVEPRERSVRRGGNLRAVGADLHRFQRELHLAVAVEIHRGERGYRSGSSR